MLLEVFVKGGNECLAQLVLAALGLSGVSRLELGWLVRPPLFNRIFGFSQAHSFTSSKRKKPPGVTQTVEETRRNAVEAAIMADLYRMTSRFASVHANYLRMP